MHKIGIAIARAPITIATGLARPSRWVSSEGKPKIPLPITVLTMRAVMVQRPRARAKANANSQGTAQYTTRIIGRDERFCFCCYTRILREKQAIKELIAQGSVEEVVVKVESAGNLPVTRLPRR